MAKTAIQNSIKVKILITMSACMILFTLASSILISILLGKRLSDRALQLNEQYLATIVNQLQDYVDAIGKLSAFCSSDPGISYALNYDNLNSLSAKRTALQAQTALDGYLSSSSLSLYTSRLVVFSMDGISITSTASQGHNAAEIALLKEYARIQSEDGIRTPVYGWHSVPSLAPETSDKTVLTCLYPLSFSRTSYMYLELYPSILGHPLSPYLGLQKIYLYNDNGNLLESTFSLESTEDTDRLFVPDGSTIHMDGHSFRISKQRIDSLGLFVCILTDVTLYAGDNRYILYLLAAILITAIAAELIVTRIITNRLTRPLQVLTSHIRKITETNDFSYSPDIVSTPDEIGAIGQAVNLMALHIQELLTQMEQMYEQRKNIEISLLQSRINPHFLYNTLDSIRWMAVIQKSRNIEQITRALENLLRNVAKGTDDKISLHQELKLVDDYIHIQKVRYVEVFDYFCQVPEELLACSIIKFTLQPIVENAIFHGLEPKGEFGEIRISAECGTGGDLFITVEDNGVGMTPEELQGLKDTLQNHDKNSLSGMGVANVDARLKLIYGPAYGLLYESLPGEYTRVIIHIPREEAEYV